MTKAKELPKSEPSIHTFAITGTFASSTLKERIYNKLKKLTESGEYEWKGTRSFSQKRTGLRVNLKPCDFGYSLTVSRINLERISNGNSLLDKIKFDPVSLSCYEIALERELRRMAVPLNDGSILWTMSRVDITQDFYVKSDPSLYIRVLRYNDPSYGKHVVKPSHYIKHNEKHSAKWKLKQVFDVTVYDKQAELKNVAKRHGNVLPQDIDKAQNCLRYEVQMERKFLRDVVEPRMRYSKWLGGWKYNWVTDYFIKLRKLIPATMQEIAMEMFGKYPWVSCKEAEKRISVLYRYGNIGDEELKLMQDYFDYNNVKAEDGRCPDRSKWNLDSDEWKTIYQILDFAQVNRTVIPEWILNEREKNKKSILCQPLWKMVQKIEDEPRCIFYEPQ